MPCSSASLFLGSALDDGLNSVSESFSRMAEAAGSEEPVVEQPAAGGQTDTENQETGQGQVDEGKVVAPPIKQAPG